MDKSSEFSTIIWIIEIQTREKYEIGFHYFFQVLLAFYYFFTYLR